MIQDFLSGAMLVFKGLHIFYNNKKLWSYALFPFLIMMIFYSAAAYLFFKTARASSGKLADTFQQLPDWLSWLGTVTNGLLSAFSAIFIILFLCTTFCTFYEFFGGFFFDSLTEYHEKIKFGIVPDKKGFRENLKNFRDSVLWGTHTFIVFCLLFAISLLLPFIGQIILIMVMGYYLGISSMISSANNSGVSVKQLKILQT